jgi:hypothetical protein
MTTSEDRFSKYKEDLLNFDEFYIADVYFNDSTRTPFIFENRAREHAEFKRQLAQELWREFSIRIELSGVSVCGSGHLGFSPVPEAGRWGRPFAPGSSDLDVAVVSTPLFLKCWEGLQANPPATDLMVKHRVLRDLFWGLLNPINLRRACGAGNAFVSAWWKVFETIDVNPAKAVHGRIYRSEFEMNRYHFKSIRLAQERLENGELD